MSGDMAARGEWEPPPSTDSGQPAPVESLAVHAHGASRATFGYGCPNAHNPQLGTRAILSESLVPVREILGEFKYHCR